MRRAVTDLDKKTRRNAFLEAALDEFFERGFVAARMEDIARRAHVTKGTLYLYYESKGALFAALVEEFAVPNIEKMERLAGEMPRAADALKALMGLAPILIRETPVPRILKVLIGDGGAFPELATAYRREAVDRVLSVIEGVLDRGRLNGEFVIDDAALAARLVVAPIVLSAIWTILFERDADTSVDLDALFELHGQFLLRALCPTGKVPS